MRKFSWHQYDVFTSRPLQGNALAIFPDARGLTDLEMQQIAKETNLSETTFILRREAAVEREHGVRVRIFTVDEELPFAGHPTLGTAMYLHDSGERAAGGTGGGKAQITLDLKAGKIPVRFEERDGLAFGEMTQRDPEFGTVLDREAVAGIARIEVKDLRDDVPIQAVSTGMGFAIVPVRSLAAIQHVRPDMKLAAEYLEKTDAKFLFFVTQETTGAAALHARMIFYNGEDPATGSAAGCCIAWAVKYGLVKSDEKVMIEQGLECRRPSQIHVQATKTGDQVVNVRVGGHAIAVARGEFFLP